ncbi:MAG: hypothetical protein ACTSUV_03960 [Candidatus Ranarchaeia archaeon]
MEFFKTSEMSFSRSIWTIQPFYDKVNQKNFLVIGGGDSKVHILDISKEISKTTDVTLSDTVRSLSVCEENGENFLVTGSWDKTLRAFKYCNFKLLETSLQETKRFVYAVNIFETPKEKGIKVLTSVGNGILQLFKLKQGSLSFITQVTVKNRIRDFAVGELQEGKPQYIACVTIAGELILMGIRDNKIGEYARIELGENLSSVCIADILGKFNGSKQIICGGMGNKLWVINYDKGVLNIEKEIEIPDILNTIHCDDLTKDGNLELILGLNDNTVRIYQQMTLKEISKIKIEQPSSIALLKLKNYNELFIGTFNAKIYQLSPKKKKKSIFARIKSAFKKN